MSVVDWMSWEGGVDVCGATESGLPGPNVIVHVARMVHTPVGSAASGMIFYQPNANANPVVAGFVSGDETVGAYFGPKIFAGTPFENAPVLSGSIQIAQDGDAITARAEAGGHVFELRLEGLSELGLVNREPAFMTPFTQQGVEASASHVTLHIDGVEVPLYVPEIGITGGPGAVSSPCGSYTR